MRNRIDGILFKRMVLNGLNNLCNHEKEINAMNVFPVADGDTGTNMRLTLENGYKHAKENKHLGDYLKELSAGMLLGARGNSGVILSQLFKGMYVSLSRCGVMNPGELRDAFITGYRTAYSAVINPVEGTILTVTREGIENIKTQIYGKINFETFFSMYLGELTKSLDRTPTLLKDLKDAGVLDSGAKGYIVIIDGMYKCLQDEIITSDNVVEEVEEKKDTTSFFDVDSKFEQGYCMEFLLQLMNEKNYQKTFNFDAFVETLKPLGNSLVALIEDTIVKVHIHTFDPSKIIILARQYGEFISFKLENMQLQHNEYVKSKKEKLPHKNLMVIAVVDGKGVESLYRDMGADYIIQGGQTMNTSSAEFVEALEVMNADDIIILPNNPNIFEAAKQAVEMSGLTNVTIIQTRTVLEGYYALAMDLPDEDNKTRINALNDGKNDIISISISSAVKDYSCGDVSCRVGDKIAVLSDKVVASESKAIIALKKALKQIEDIDDKSALIVIKGGGFIDEFEEEIQELIDDDFSHLEVQFIDGGEHVYDALIGII